VLVLVLVSWTCLETVSGSVSGMGWECNPVDSGATDGLRAGTDGLRAGTTGTGTMEGRREDEGER
jgi:hypothetical protein